MDAKTARLLAIAYIRESLKQRVSHVAGYLGLAKALGVHYRGMTKSGARRAVSVWAADNVKIAVNTEFTARPPKKRPQASFYDTREWRELRYQALTAHGGKCQCCGRSSKDGVVLHVDHIKPKSKFPRLALSLDNLQVLCADCNLGKSNKDQTDWR